MTDLLAPNTIMEEAALHASLYHPVGSDEYYLEAVGYMAVRIDHEVAPQAIRLMVVLFHLPVTDEQIDRICDYVHSDDYCPEEDHA